MVSHQETVEIIRDTIRRNERVPDEISYIIHEPDTEGRDADVSLPLLQIEIAEVTDDDISNSTFSGYIYDDYGNEVGRSYERKWEMNLFLYLWSVESSAYDVQELAEAVKRVLYDHEERGPSKPFRKQNGEHVDDIWGFRLEGSQREDDFGQTPTIRRIRIELLVRGSNKYRQSGFEPVLETDKEIETE